MFEDLALADYGNRIPSLTFEVEADAAPVPIGAVAAALSAGRLEGDGLAAVDGFAAGGADIRAAIAPLVEAHGLALRSGADGLKLTAVEAVDGTIGADGLALGALVEVECVAVRPGVR